MLEKHYNSKIIEQKITDSWDKKKAFLAGKGAEPFCIVMPPPNITGSLHIGHALNSTIQDIVVRFERMRKKNVLWQPGLDHAGIATQMVVERQLDEKNQPSRLEMGRESFVKKIWEWRDESGGLIVQQLRRLGISCDWSRERFTMDEGISKAVRKVFTQLYKEGLIYKDKRLVNWDPKFKTAISDLEVESIEQDGNLWYFRYPLENTKYDPEDSKSYIVIATTRPETMLGDVAIAVHPSDERYKHLIGKNALLPIIGRKLPIIADEYVEPEFGTGAVKITPAHDFNDFEIGRRHHLKPINILDYDANLSLDKNEDFFCNLDISSEKLISFVKEFHGLERNEARKKLTQSLESQTYLSHVEKHKHMVPFGDRSQVVIEPFLTEQWYVNAQILAQPAIKAVREKTTNFIPQNWEKTYFQWMENIQPWCISRQLWWGHRIPAWYGPDGHIFVEETEKKALEVAREYYNQKNVTLTQDEDVLDTWFSSALWPFSTLNWPQENNDLKTYYPTALLVTGFDIIFFWVARMMMMGLHFIGEVPFKKIYVHALVRDKFGAKMSKSKGNVIDPLVLMDEYGADALRFTLAVMAAQGRDVKLDPKRIEGYRNFATKLWNASRFSQMNGAYLSQDFKPESVKYAVNSWILTLLSQTIYKVTLSIEDCKFNEASQEVYHFVWGTFCDWYIELSKPILLDKQHEDHAETKNVIAFCLNEIYKLLHPFMPFITEELWQIVTIASTESYEAKSSLLALSEWPNLKYNNEKAVDEISALISFISDIRSIRKEMNVPASAMLLVVMEEVDDRLKNIILTYEKLLSRLARIEKISWDKGNSKKSAHCTLLTPLGNISYRLPLEEFIDFEKEKSRLLKEKEKLEANLSKLNSRLNNKKFLENASPYVIEADKTLLKELQIAYEKNRMALTRF